MPTKTMESTALALRFRESVPTSEIPDTDAFRPRGQPTEDRVEEIGVLHVARSKAPADRMAVFLTSSDFGIPQPVLSEDPPAMPSLESWRLRPAAFGHLAIVSKPRRAAPSSRPAWLFAACLPLVAPTMAHAAPAAVQRPQSGATSPPVLPSRASEQAPQTESASGESLPVPVVQREVSPAADADPSGPAVQHDVSAADANTLIPVVRHNGSPAAGPVPSAANTSIPVVRHNGSPAAEPVPSAIMDAAWEGVDGFMVELQLKGGGRRKGRVGAVQKDTFTLIDATQGQVLVLAKSSVVSLRVAVPPPLPSKTGNGLIAGGSVLLSVGAPTALTGLVFLGICPSCVEVHLPLLMVGAATLGGGIPMVILGARRRRAYNHVLREHQVLPAVSWTPHGWNGSIRFRF